MSVDYLKKEYSDNVNVWEKCRDVVEGQERIHLQGEKYLEKLSGQNSKEYEAYVSRALFYNATQRTVDAMSGLLFRKDPAIDIPTALEPYTENIDLKGNNLKNFAENIADEVLIAGRIGLLADHATVVNEEGEEITQAAADANNLRPFLAQYKAEAIINWGYKIVNNVQVLHFVVLKECLEEYDTTTFEPTEIIKYRVLALDDTNKYYQQIWLQEGEKGEPVKQGEDIYPTKNGQYFDRIPFVFISSKGLESEIVKAPILDLVNVNLSHYKSTADIEHAAHYTALPTPIVKGHRIAEDKVLKIGSREAWVFPEAEADAKYLEFTGKGLDALEQRIEKKEQQMAALGARMLASEKAAAETAETHNIKRQGENSALSSVAQSVSDGIEKALMLISEWAGITGDVKYDINKDFIPASLSSQDLLALLQTYLSGGMAKSDFFEKLKEGEIIKADRKLEEMEDEIENSGITVGEADEDIEGEI
jgi:hypothetical protein